MPERRLYKVVFSSQGKVYEIYARSVGQGSIFGFVEVEELLFGQKTQVVVDPTEEQLRNEFRGVRRTHIPLHSVIRIDEVEKEGVSRIAGDANGSVAAFPVPVPPKGGDKG